MYGFFNYCIYCYPRFRRIKGYFPEKSLWWCLRLLYTKDQGESEIAQQRIRKRHQLLRGNLLQTSFGTISFSGTFEQPDPLQQQDMPESNEKNLESTEGQLFHHSGGTAIVITSDDEVNIESDSDIVMTNRPGDIDDKRTSKCDTSSILTDVEMPIGVIAS